MRTAWLKFGCYLTGYNYDVLQHCSEVARKTVKRYTAALLIMSILWGLIGYSFASRYLHAGPWWSALAALLFVLLIIQIERQIIMQTHRNNYLQFFRGWIAVMMALIGSLIIDQIIFKDDIELEKETFINAKVNAIYPDRAAERRRQLAELDSVIMGKEVQRSRMLDDIRQNPTTTITNVNTNPVLVPTTTQDSAGRTITTNQVRNVSSVSTSQIANPNAALLAPLDSQLTQLRQLKVAKEDSLTHLRTSIENTLKQKTGFLDELNIMWSLLSKSPPAAVVYIIWFLLLLGLELFILMNKRHEQPTDYDHLINHQMDTHIRRLEVLKGKGSVQDV